MSETGIQGGRLLVECLVNHGVRAAFGVPGESYLAVLDALHDVGSRLRLVVSRHEGGASFMAEAWGKLTGQPGICFVTRGPGATNAAIGVHTAMQNSTPMILFVGQVGREMRRREAFQEIDYPAFFGDIAKWVTEIDNPARIPEIVARAFAVATSGRPGPVVIALPQDMLRAPTTAAATQPGAIGHPAPDRAGLDAARAALRKAERPVLLVGGGGWSEAARADLNRFAERNRLPVAVVFRSQDLVDNASASYVGDAGVGMAPYLAGFLGDADLILAINIRFGESTTQGWRLFDVPRMAPMLVHAHESAREIGKIYQPDIALVTSPENLMHELAAGPALGDWQAWRDRGRKGFLDMRAAARQQGAVDMVEICAWLDRQLDNDAIITNGAGNFAIWPSKFITYTGGRRLLAPQSGAMGAGLPAAIAARLAAPGRQVLCFAGDGDFQMTMAEMGTAAQEGLQPIILLLNNGMYGTIRAHQERNYPGRVSGTEIRNPDYVAIARANGFHGERIERTADFAPAFARAAASTTGGLLEIVIDPEDITPFARLSDLRAAGVGG